MADIKLSINGQAVTVPEGSTIYQAAAQNGFFIPTFCHQPELQPFTACFICVVEVQGMPNPVPSCSVEAKEGMVVQTETPGILAARRMCLELLLSDHCGDCFSPCHTACPAGCDAQGYVNLLAEGKPAEALKLIKETLPIPCTLGRVCPHPCEDKCRRAGVEQAVAICALKRAAADADINSHQPFLPEVKTDSGKKVAVVGAGPAGLSAAYYLRQEGHQVDIYEARPKPGGMIRYGIPAFRMPRELLDREIETITALGIAMHYNQAVGRDIALADLQAGYDAVFLALGAQAASSMECEGETLPGVMTGMDFLARVSAGESLNLGNKVLVVGGGNTAIDACRTSLRLGAREVALLYRRTRKEMPAYEPEVHEAEREGVQLQFLAAPVKIISGSRGLEVIAVKMQLGEPDASGRRRPVPQAGSEFSLDADTVISAIGQKVDSAYWADQGIEVDRWKQIKVNPETLQTNKPNIFAGGDCVTGPDIAVRAVGAGRLAACSIDQFLKGEALTGITEIKGVNLGEVEEVPPSFFAGRETKPRAKMPEIDFKDRLTGFTEIETGLVREVAQSEAARCLECGCKSVNACKLRDYAILYGADFNAFRGARRDYSLDDSHKDVTLEFGKCIMCGNCLRVCAEVKRFEVYGFVKRGFGAAVRPYFDMPLGATNCDGCKQCIPVCPTGAVLEHCPISENPAKLKLKAEV